MYKVLDTTFTLDIFIILLISTTFSFHFSTTGPFKPNNKHVQFKDVLKLHNSMIGGANTTRQTLSDATATYDLTGTYLVNEKEGK